MKNVFGRSISFVFTPTIDGEPVKVHSLVTARLYSSIPSDAQEANTDTSCVEEVAAWTDEGLHGKKITFSALTDSDQHSSEAYEDYFVTVRFRYQNGGPIVFATEKIFIYRPDAITSRISATIVDLERTEKAGAAFFKGPELDQFLGLAKTRIFRRFKGLGKEMQRMFNLEELNEACVELAASLLCESLFKSAETTHWREKADRHYKVYDEIFAATEVGYDNDGDDEPDEDEHTSQSGAVWMMR